MRVEKDIISDFTQGDFWKEKSKEFDSDKFVVPLFMFYDDIEVGNALGSDSGANKLGAVYFTIPSFPSHIMSNLSNIIVKTLFYSKDRAQHGNPPVFSRVVNELNNLRKNGLTIHVDGKPEIVYFQLGLILGDNLGLNAILGFFESFNSNRPCRVCKAFIDQIKSLTEERQSLIRQKVDYDLDCINSNQSLTGISEKCFFNRIVGFHVLENITLDLMHDLFEGFGNDIMVKVLKNFLFEEKYFDLNNLNATRANFGYGTKVEGNKIPKIKKEHITDKEKLKMSAAEMMCFIRYFGLLFFDKVPSENPLWQLYLQLREIVGFVTSPRLVKSHCSRFEYLYKEFLTTYTDLYGASMKFKLHNLTHFLRIMKRNGPLTMYWSMRYESKHRHLTLTATSSNCKKNVLRTIALKSQLMLAQTCTFETFSAKNIDFKSRQEIDPLSKQICFPVSRVEDRIHQLNSLSINGVDYATNSVIVMQMGDDDLLKFGQVLQIFLKNDFEVYLYLKILKVEFFDEDIYAYRVVEAKTSAVLKKWDDLPKLHPCLLKKNCHLFIVTKYNL